MLGIQSTLQKTKTCCAYFFSGLSNFGIAILVVEPAFPVGFAKVDMRRPALPFPLAVGLGSPLLDPAAAGVDERGGGGRCAARSRARLRRCARPPTVLAHLDEQKRPAPKVAS